MDFEALESILNDLREMYHFSKLEKLKKQIDALEALFWSIQIGLK